MTRAELTSKKPALGTPAPRRSRPPPPSPLSSSSPRHHLLASGSQFCCLSVQVTFCKRRSTYCCKWSTARGGRRIGERGFTWASVGAKNGVAFLRSGRRNPGMQVHYIRVVHENRPQSWGKTIRVNFTKARTGRAGPLRLGGKRERCHARGHLRSQRLRRGEN